MLHIVPDGINYACALSLAGLILSYFLDPFLGIPLYLVALFCLWFFRDPERKIPDGDVMVAPADGRIVSIKAGPEEETRLSIFLNVFNVHVARSPVAGRIAELTRTKGKFRVASLDEASVENEKSTIRIDARGRPVVFSLIAGLIARRIICYKREGETVARGERIGLMKFGSRVDVFISGEWSVVVESGQKVSAGTTIIARLSEQETV
ncbi:MAG: phosphatidylserine decarboxylase [Bryobacteraceae bacterium]